MFDLRTVPHTDPVDIYRVRDGIYAADMLLAAITSQYEVFRGGQVLSNID